MLQDNTPGREGREGDKTCTILYTMYDAQRLAEVVGKERASLMLNASKNIHMFMTGDKT